MATIFCAAAVLIPIFHIETACTAVIIMKQVYYPYSQATSATAEVEKPLKA